MVNEKHILFFRLCFPNIACSVKNSKTFSFHTTYCVLWLYIMVTCICIYIPDIRIIYTSGDSKRAVETV